MATKKKPETSTATFTSMAVFVDGEQTACQGSERSQSAWEKLVEKGEAQRSRVKRGRRITDTYTAPPPEAV